MKRLLKSALRSVGLEVSRVRPPRIRIGEIDFEQGPCTIISPESAPAAEGLKQMVAERDWRHLSVLDICCGVGVLGLSLFAGLRERSIVSEIVFADINIFNLNALEQTLERNGLGAMVGKQVRWYLTDGLSHLPPQERFDLIVGNPPHYSAATTPSDNLSAGRLGTYDVGWKFHDAFYAAVDRHLKPGGEIWLLENAAAARTEDFLPFVQANGNLEYVQSVPESRNPRFFWMMSKRRAAQAPAANS